MAKEISQIIAELHDALEMAANDLADDGDYVLNRWVIVLDTTRMDSGFRQHQSVYDPKEAPWDVKGMLYEAIDTVTYVNLPEDGEDDDSL